jgi:alpha-methylacyl-CoA racemase
MKAPEDKRLAAILAQQAEILIEGFRHGVMERLGFGPEDVLRANPKLAYGRMTGWGQHGPLAQAPPAMT